MRALALVCCFASLVGCETFRSLDSVPRPSDAEDGLDLSLDAAAAVDVGRDASVADASDLGSRPDLPTTTDVDVPTDVNIRPDADGPRRCPDAGASRPYWASSTALVIGDFDIDDSGLTEANVSVAASAWRQTPERFIAAYRVTEGNSLNSRVVAIENGAVVESTVAFHAVADSFADIAVARTPDPATFAFVATIEAAGCSLTGPEAVSGTIYESGGNLVAQSSALIFETCDLFQPGAAILGPSGTSPNMVFFATNNATSDVLAYEWDAVDQPMATDGQPMSARVSTSSRDLVAIPTADPAAWKLWRPALSPEPTVAGFGATGDVSVEHVFDECYVGVSPQGADLGVTAIDCTTVDCLASVPRTFSGGDTVSRSAVARMPGGGFVVASAIGGADQSIEFWFFDDAFNRITVAGSARHELLSSAGAVADLAIAATNRADGTVVVLVVYSVVGVDQSVRAATMQLAGVAF